MYRSARVFTFHIAGRKPHILVNVSGKPTTVIIIIIIMMYDDVTPRNKKNSILILMCVTPFVFLQQ